MSGKRTAVVIPAAGSATRMGASLNKQFLTVGSRPMLAHTIQVFCDTPEITDIVVVLNPDERTLFEETIQKPYGFKNLILADGGSDRQSSVYNGLKKLDPQTDYVLVQDGARPFTTREIILRCLEQVERTGAAVTAVPAKNTIKQVSKEGVVLNTPPRETLYEAQTPQGFDYALLMKANEKALKEGFTGTDDASIVEYAGYPVSLCEGDENNIKLTTPEDLLKVRALIHYLDELTYE